MTDLFLKGVKSQKKYEASDDILTKGVIELYKQCIS